MDVLDRNIAAYITNCILGVTDEPLNMILANSQPRSESGVLKLIHQAVKDNPGHPKAIQWVNEKFSNSVVKSLREENESLRKHLEEHIEFLEEIAEDLDKVNKLLKEPKEPERRAEFYRSEGYAWFKVFKNGVLDSIVGADAAMTSYVVEGLREKYPGIKIEEV